MSYRVKCHPVKKETKTGFFRGIMVKIFSGDYGQNWEKEDER